MTKTLRPVGELTYEQALEEFEEIMDELETGSGKLEETVVLYERGRELLHRCQELLNQAELHVQQLMEEGDLAEIEDGS